MSKKRKSHTLLEWGKAVLLAVGLALIIRLFLFEPYLVEGSSMDPTLHDGDRLFVSKSSFMIGDVKRGDIVIIDSDEKDVHYVKRVIGLSGDTVEVKGHKLKINGKQLEEPYLLSNEKKAEKLGMFLMDDFEPVTVPKHDVFVMGDNRTNSMDSRNGLGFISKDRIAGKAEFVFFPFEKIRKTK
ncbi:signal peptidase I [Metabacillus idriensis]|jgi:signal peptidase I|uniref:Signal peptidase I n=1 Tax=Metabacillus idriensis TaxID=324768 RepID=A0A6I2M5K4_9BACI|nr:signal peptidase I [Metabacillus idriensis]MCM3594540.1 signal peptidase I [Metabacillus idriensis]MRX53430.1 signal peptidase I [Metabacillus idriensis]OHR73089.1 S26 family signal peptidase [Bacillus sp. HMSC76G11]